MSKELERCTQCSNFVRTQYIKQEGMRKPETDRNTALDFFCYLFFSLEKLVSFSKHPPLRAAAVAFGAVSIRPDGVGREWACPLRFTSPPPFSQSHWSRQ